MQRINVSLFTGTFIFYRASACIRMQSAILFYLFCLSVRLSNAGTVSK